MLKLIFEENKIKPVYKDADTSFENYNLIDSAFDEYSKFDSIERGFLSNDTYNWIVDTFDLENKNTDEINQLWFDIDKYFENLMLSEDGESWRHGDITVDEFMFLQDTSSAWLEALNEFSRRRRADNEPTIPSEIFEFVGGRYDGKTVTAPQLKKMDLKGYLSPMIDKYIWTDDNGNEMSSWKEPPKDTPYTTVYRYETQDVYDMLSH